MPYIVTKTSGSVLTTVPDNTVNLTTTSLALVGKNYTGYGAFLNDNYIRLLENFSNGAAPTNPIIGQIWFDSINTVLKVYTGSIWKQIHTSVASSSTPGGSITGDLWWDTTTVALKVWSGSSWVVIGPPTSTATGTSGALVDTIIDTLSVSHTILKFSITNNIIAIISKDSSTYTPVPAIPGFGTIRPGLNLVNSSVLTDSQFTGSQITLGVSSNVTISDSLGAVNITGTTSNSDLNLWVNKGNVSTKALGITGTTAKVTISNELQVTGVAALNSNVAISGVATLSSTLSVAGITSLSSNLLVTGSTALGSALSVAGITTVSGNIIPNTDNVINIGGSGTKFANLHVNKVNATTIESTQTSASSYLKTGVFATTTARDSAIATPAAGMIVFVTADTKFYGYNGSTWTALN